MMAVPELHREKNKTKKTKTKQQPLESYSMFQLRSKTMSSRIKQQSSDNRSSLRLCVNTDSFVLHFVPFCLSGSSEVAVTAIKRLQIAIAAAGERLRPTDGIYQTYLGMWGKPSAPHVMSPSWQEAQWGNTVTEGVTQHSLASSYMHTHTHSFLLLMELFLQELYLRWISDEVGLKRKKKRQK